MSTYRGVRRPDGQTEVTVDGQPLPLRLDLVNHSPTGFEWGYGGSGPAQLALAILAHHFKDERKVLDYYQQFKFVHVAGWGEQWEISSEQIGKWLEAEAEAKAAGE